MTKKHNCTRCKKTIAGKIKIVTYRKKLGKKLISCVDEYCEACHKIVNKERALRNEHCKQKRTRKTKG